jgi:HSP20 family protein
MVMRFDSFRDLDRLAEQVWGGAERARSIPMDAYRRGDEVFLHFDLPGIAPDAIDLTVEQNVLTVSAERSYHVHEEDQILARERATGAFSRQVLLGEHLDAGRLEASSEMGVLTVKIPVAPEAKPRRVEIRAGDHSSGRQVIDVEEAKG